MIYLCFDYRSTSLDKLLPIIPKSERNRIENQLKNHEKQLQSATVWAILSRVANLNENTVIARNPHGKPYIVDSGNFFSLSHCETCVAVAVSDMPVGIDAEKIKNPYPEAVARRIFSEKTCEEIANAVNPSTAFYLKWTQYESFLKVFGTDADFSTADSSLFHSEVVDDVALSVCCKTRHEIKVLPISVVLSGVI